MTDATICFTPAFKEEFLRRYKEGLLPKQIVQEPGYRDILGVRRIEGLRDHIVKGSQSGAGLHEGTLHSKIRPCSRDYTTLPESRAIEYMQHELLYLRQEVEFVKKLLRRTTLRACRHCGYQKGARGIHMRLLHEEPPIRMNVKKICRLMKKFGLFCPIRKANPYWRMMKALKTGSVADNLLQREFEEHGPGKALLTDITCIPCNGIQCCLSTILDACTRQILSCAISDSLKVDFVLKTVHQMVEDHGISLDCETLIHSGQGSHYTSLKFIQIVKDSGSRQSMSRRGNCWDNAPQESFYGHMKDEIALSDCGCFADVCPVSHDWMDYYKVETL